MCLPACAVGCSKHVGQRSLNCVVAGLCRVHVDLLIFGFIRHLQSLELNLFVLWPSKSSATWSVCIDKVTDVSLELARFVFRVVGVVLWPPCRCRHDAFPKRRRLFTNGHYDTSQNTWTFNKIAVRILHYSVVLLCLQIWGYEILLQVTVGFCYLFTLTLVLTGHVKSWNDVRNLYMLLLPREPLRLQMCLVKPRAYNTENEKTSRLHRRIKTKQKWVINPLKPSGATCSNIKELRVLPTLYISVFHSV